MNVTRGKIVVSEDRLLFARWLRRIAKQRAVALTAMRDDLGFERKRWGRVVKDRPHTGAPEVPTDEECRLIAQYLSFTNIAFVLELAETARAAARDRVEIVVMPDGSRVKLPLQKD